MRTRSRRAAIAGWFLEMSVLMFGVPASLEFIREGNFDITTFAGYAIVGLMFAGIGLYLTKEDF